jgi:CheY-like chemotaxis protein
MLTLTANAFAADPGRCIEAGKNDSVPKPFTPNQPFALLLDWLT